jgi:hypothetical protein
VDLDDFRLFPVAMGIVAAAAIEQCAAQRQALCREQPCQQRGAAAMHAQDQNDAATAS